MLKIIMLTLTLNGGNVMADQSDYYDTIDDCQIVAAMMQEEAVFEYRLGYEPRAYVCEMVKESEA
jgi:hypothetical protein